MARVTPEAIKATQTLSQHHRPRLKLSRSVSTQHSGLTAKNDSQSKNTATRETRQKTADRHLILNVLSANASKRDARSYLANFKPVPRPQFSHPDRGDLPPTRVSPKAVIASQSGDLTTSNVGCSRDSISSTPKSAIDQWIEPLRSAIVLLKLDKTLSDDTLESLGRTLSQLSRLGMSPVVVIKCSLSGLRPHQRCDEVRRQVNRVVAAIEKTEGQRAQAIENALVADGDTSNVQARLHIQERPRLDNRKRLLNPMERGVIPVVAPLSFSQQTGSLDVVAPSDAVMALIRDFAGLKESAGGEDSENQAQISLDRLIILDSNGGIPRGGRGLYSHVFVNLEQEYDDICSQLDMKELSEDTSESHFENIQLAREALSLLPPTSSAIISSHDSAAAGSALQSPSGPRNPLIHNLLTDKPLFSSSLPHSRLSSQSSRPSPPTLLKHGMPVTIFPSPRVQEWTPPSASSPPFSLADPALDIPRLVELIEDSFGRPLDAHSYFERIAPVLAGIVVAGAYDGCAILTWEPVPGSQTADPVPYLDKLAVRRASQGAGSVADILFNAMVRDCFPQGVVWRSRSVNPVNGWYFERARGSWRIPKPVAGSHWTMFWTTEDVSSKRFEEYAGVCGSLGSYWSDGKPAE